MNKKTIEIVNQCAEHHEFCSLDTMNKLEALTATMKKKTKTDKEFNRVYRICQKQMNRMHIRYAKAIRSLLKEIKQCQKKSN